MRAALAVSRVASRGQPVDRAVARDRSPRCRFSASALTPGRAGCFSRLVRRARAPGLDVARRAPGRGARISRRRACQQHPAGGAGRRARAGATPRNGGLSRGADWRRRLSGSARGICPIRRSCSGRRATRTALASAGRGDRRIARRDARRARHRAQARAGPRQRGFGRGERAGAGHRRRRARGRARRRWADRRRAGLRRGRGLSSRASGSRRAHRRAAARSSASSRRACRRSRTTFRCAIASSAGSAARVVVVEAVREERVAHHRAAGARAGAGRAGGAGRNVVSGRHRGCHALIKDGARLVETVGRRPRELGWTLRPPAPPARTQTKSLQMSRLEANDGDRRAVFASTNLAARTRPLDAGSAGRVGRARSCGTRHADGRRSWLRQT